MQRDNIEVSDAQKHYDEYKAEHQKKQADIFFSSHKDQPWFREKYDPEESYKYKQEQIAQAQILARKFIEEFVDNIDHKCHGLSLDEDPSTNY